MKKLWILGILVLVGTLACGETALEPPDQPTTPEPTATPKPTATREAMLEEVADTLAEGFEKREWASIYAIFPSEYREKCAYVDFVVMHRTFFDLMGLSEDTTVTVSGTRIEGDEAWVYTLWEQDGAELDLGFEDEAPSLVWQDGRWWAKVSPEDLAKDNPCATAGTASQAE